MTLRLTLRDHRSATQHVGKHTVKRRPTSNRKPKGWVAKMIVPEAAEVSGN